MPIPAKHAFYGDLNCPYCFAQHERIVELGFSAEIEWRGVVHMPDLPIPPKLGPRETEMLRCEVESVRARMPSLVIRLPNIRPNSRPATLLLAAAAQIAPECALNLRMLLYRALWRDDRDISDPIVLGRLVREAGCPSISATREDELLQQRWQEQWEQTERRIPSIQSPHGAWLLGLADDKRLTVFLKSGRLSSLSEDAC